MPQDHERVAVDDHTLATWLAGVDRLASRCEQPIGNSTTPSAPPAAAQQATPVRRPGAARR